LIALFSLVHAAGATAPTAMADCHMTDPVNPSLCHAHAEATKQSLPIAAPMVGGMITAPLLSLFVVPAVYLLLRRRALRRVQGRRLGMMGNSAGATTP
jgi:hypothetical protein